MAELSEINSAEAAVANDGGEIRRQSLYIAPGEVANSMSSNGFIFFDIIDGGDSVGGGRCLPLEFASEKLD